MKKNKGFTLIELLAVIVILAILAVIATPIVVNTISNTQIEAQKRSVEAYAKTIEAAYYQKWNETHIQPGTTIVTGGSFVAATGNITSSDINYGGSSVACDSISIDNTNKIIMSGCHVGGDNTRSYSYTNGQAIEEVAS